MSLYSIEDLLYLMERLRDPDGGCPWDLKQSFDTIAPHTLEETYEVIDAIQNKDFPHLKEELGDLLLQIIFYAQMANEQNYFDFNDVVSALVAKLIRRHPHVFPDGKLYASAKSNQKISAEEVKIIWEKVKASERAERNKKLEQQGVISQVSRTLPTLKRAQKIQETVANYGFDWPNIAPVFDKLREEIDELEQACQQNNDAEMMTELGDVLFSMVALARHLKLDAEYALGDANQKFVKRFAYIEKTLTYQGLSLDVASFEEMEKLWQEAKSKGM